VDGGWDVHRTGYFPHGLQMFQLALYRSVSFAD
jgi:hypothetical protein